MARSTTLLEEKLNWKCAYLIFNLFLDSNALISPLAHYASPTSTPSGSIYNRKKAEYSEAGISRMIWRWCSDAYNSSLCWIWIMNVFHPKLTVINSIIIVAAFKCPLKSLNVPIRILTGIERIATEWPRRRPCLTCFRHVIDFVSKVERIQLVSLCVSSKSRWANGSWQICTNRHGDKHDWTTELGHLTWSTNIYQTIVTRWFTLT